MEFEINAKLSKSQRMILDRVLRKAKESTQNMIQICEDAINKKDFQGDKAQAANKRACLLLDLADITSIEEKFTPKEDI